MIVAAPWRGAALTANAESVSVFLDHGRATECVKEARGVLHPDAQRFFGAVRGEGTHQLESDPSGATGDQYQPASESFHGSIPG